MSGVRVNLIARNDVIGDVLRQKQTLDRVSEVLCDGLGDDPARTWRVFAGALRDPQVADRLRAIADLIEETNL